MQAIAATTQQASRFSDQTVAVQGGRDLTISAAQGTYRESVDRTETRKGLMGAGTGFTIGTQEQGNTQTRQGTRAAGSVAGDVTLVAGGTYHQEGSAVLAPQGDVTIVGKKVEIVEARQSEVATDETRFKQSGLTVAVSNPVVSAAQTALAMKDAAQASGGDKRLQALAGASTALAAKNAADQVAKDPKAAGGLGISVTVGTSRSESKTTTTSETAAGSSINAGGRLAIQATGAGADSTVTVRGSDLTAGGNALIAADGKILLEAARNTSELERKSSSMSAGVGVAIQVGSGGASMGVTANASGGRGSAEGTDVTWTNTHVNAGGKLALQSGGDTVLKGAVASGQRVEADIGGKLIVESLQDTSTYKSKDQSLGGSATVGAGFSGSVNASQQKVASDYASVLEQSAIRAGDGGFQIKAKDETVLAGGAISSTQAAIAAGANRLETAALVTSDISNRASYQASSVGIGGGVSVGKGGMTPLGEGKEPPAPTASAQEQLASQAKYALGKAAVGSLLGQGNEAGKEDGLTRSAMSAGAIVITDAARQEALTGQSAAQAEAALNRDTEGAQTAVSRPDVQAIEKKVAAEHAIRSTAYTQAAQQTADLVYAAMTAEKKIILQRCEAGGQNCTQTEVDAKDVKVGPDGKAYAYNNGILNTEGEALANAAKQSGDAANAQGVYVIINPYTGNAVAEVMYAAWDKLNEAVFGGGLAISNAAEANIDLRNQVATQDGKVIEVDHSRGSLTSANATATQIRRGETVVPLESVTFNGAAANAERMAETVKSATGGTGLVFQSTHISDPVGTWIGGNSGTGGIPSWDFIGAHGSYFGYSPKEFLDNGDKNPARALLDNFWGKGGGSNVIKIEPKK